jgi:hypothetical protein
LGKTGKWKMKLGITKHKANVVREHCGIRVH